MKQYRHERKLDSFQISNQIKENIVSNEILLEDLNSSIKKTSHTSNEIENSKPLVRLSDNANSQNEFEDFSLIRKIIKKGTENYFKIIDLKCPTEVDKQSTNAINEYGNIIDKNMKELEKINSIDNCLIRHEITPALRARMIDWMIEVLTNFKFIDESFFLAVSIMDRFTKKKNESLAISNLHLIGITSMYIASKFEDLYPMRMKLAYEKIGHKKFPIDIIKTCEADILKTLGFLIHIPTALDYIKTYLKIIMNNHPEKELIKRMAIYLAKMNLHDYNFCSIKPSLQAAASIFVSVTLSEQIKKIYIINSQFIITMCNITGYQEEQIKNCSQKILFNAKNFETQFPGLFNLKNTNFAQITECLK